MKKLNLTQMETLTGLKRQSIYIRVRDKELFRDAEGFFPVNHKINKKYFKEYNINIDEIEIPERREPGRPYSGPKEKSEIKNIKDSNSLELKKEKTIREILHQQARFANIRKQYLSYEVTEKYFFESLRADEAETETLIKNLCRDLPPIFGIDKTPKVIKEQITGVLKSELDKINLHKKEVTEKFLNNNKPLINPEPGKPMPEYGFFELAKLSKSEIDEIKIQVQNQHLKLKVEIQKKILLPRDTVKRFTANLYSIEQNEFISSYPMHVTPYLSGIFSCNDEIILLKAQERITAECYDFQKKVKERLKNFLQAHNSRKAL